MFTRDAETILGPILDSPDGHVLLIQGARQVGKTSLVENLLAKRQDTISVNLEENSEARDLIDRTTQFEDFEFVMSQTFGFDRKRRQILFIDEAQESERLGFYVRFFKEKWKRTIIILTGSSMTRLFRPDQRIPVGRYNSFLITPLNFREFLRFGKHDAALEILDRFETSLDGSFISDFLHTELLKHVDSYLQVGGLPNVVLTFSDGGNYSRQMNNIFLSQEDDFVRKTSLEERTLFRQGLKGVASFLGYPSKQTHIHERSYMAGKLISLLQAWNLIFEVEQHGMASTTAFYPKRYIYDCGIAQFVREMPFPRLSLINSADPALRTQLGGLIENMVLHQLVSERLGFYHISGWKKDSHSGTEVDFVWRENERTIPFECKAALRIHQRNFSALRQYLTQTHLKVGFLISAAPFKRLHQDGVTLFNIPLYLSQPLALRKLAKNC